MPSGLRSSMLPRTGKGFPAAAQLIRGVVSKLNSSSETMSKIWGIRSGERGDTHPGGPVRADTRPPQSHQSPPPPRVFHLSGHRQHLSHAGLQDSKVPATPPGPHAHLYRPPNLPPAPSASSDPPTRRPGPSPASPPEPWFRPLSFLGPVTDPLGSPAPAPPQQLGSFFKPMPDSTPDGPLQPFPVGLSYSLQTLQPVFQTPRELTSDHFQSLSSHHCPSVKAESSIPWPLPCSLPGHLSPILRTPPEITPLSRGPPRLSGWSGPPRGSHPPWAAAHLQGEEGL